MPEMILVCSLCGRQLQLAEGESLVQCPACDTLNARPAAKGPSLEMLNHAVRQRIGCDFHNAENSYQQVLLYHPEEHEALWGRLLCHYGVEHVKDPATGDLVPVVHTVRPRPMQSQPEFAAACDNAPAEVRARYRREAAYIDEAQFRVRMLAESCPPYDVFICHKTTEVGSSRKTEDFQRAYQLYHLLKEEGVRAFFAPECLTAVAGADYEAGIYHAIHTARVMLVLCSKAEYLTSAWVRSEWSRYLKRMDDGENVRLVPLLYDHFSLADCPAEFRLRNLQGLTMGELDSTQKLLEIVRGVVGRDAPAPVPAAAAAPATDKLLERAHLYLEDGDWDKADEYAEKVLDQEPKNGRAYVVKVLARYKARTLEMLKQQKDTSYEQDGNYQKALRFGDAALKGQLQAVGEAIRARIAEERRAAAYAAATQTLQQQDYSKAEQQFAALRGYRDAAEKAAECRRQEEARLTVAYDAAMQFMQQKFYTKAELRFQELGGFRDAADKVRECQRLEEERIEEEKRQRYERAAQARESGHYWQANKAFAALGNYRDAPAQARECQRRMEERREAEEHKAAAKRSWKIGLTALAVAVVLLSVWCYNGLILPAMRYNSAMDLLQERQYDAAYVAFVQLGDYSDAATRAKETCYLQGEALLAAGKYAGASTAFAMAGDYSNAMQRIGEPYYVQAEALLTAGDYDGAYAAFVNAGSYSDAATRAKETCYLQGEALLVAGDYDGAYAAFVNAGSYSDAVARARGIRYQQASALMTRGEYDAAYAIYITLPGYKDVNNLLATDENLLAAAAAAAAEAALRAQYAVGNIVTYGSYEGRALQWRVLAVEGDRVLLLAETSVAYKAYNDTHTSITWEKCTLRQWLNNDFLNAAFTAEERGRIAMITVIAEDNATYDTEAGNSTQDRLFLLSISEVRKYLPQDADRVCRNASGEPVRWRLRSPGSGTAFAAGVYSSGEVDAVGDYVMNDHAVRPAFWLDISDLPMP